MINNKFSFWISLPHIFRSSEDASVGIRPKETLATDRLTELCSEVPKIFCIFAHSFQQSSCSQQSSCTFISTKHRYEGLHRGKRSKGEQFEERQRPHSPQPSGRADGRVGIGQVVARLRPPLCRGATALRREPLVLRTPVFGPYGQTRGRFHRGIASRHCY